MTCCTKGEQLFAWQAAYPDTTIDVMNEKPGFIRPGNSLPLIHGTVSMFPGPMMLGHQRHTSGAFVAQSHIQQCPLNCVFRNTCAWTCIVLGCQLSHCLLPILLYQVGQSSTSFFFDDAWTTNTLTSTAGVTVIYPLCINTNNCRS
ncbi:hypothetical protein AVEN_275624-1 [Araneus ventricosus]|uniref:Uncharacterized protein n=1 Tax=Araneus ventricosus TaxID=182803 RepID=A0A4Y2KCL4_ARAVE|nr:hypothetical protein AVEN_275624-1 [Araneus ventricosus]